MKTTGLAILTLLLIFQSACNGDKREFTSEEEARAYANDNGNGFIETVEFDEHIFSAKINPIRKGDDAFTINLRISRQDGQPVLQHQELTPSELTDKEMYLSFDLPNDVYLRVDGKQIQPVLHHYERTYKLKPSIDVAFTFPVVTPKAGAAFVYRDRLFGSGLQEIPFDNHAFEPYTIKE